MNNSNIDQTIEYVKNIVDNIRCAICDKIEDHQMRYSCGHTACINCVTDIEDCQICLNPHQTSNPQPKPDDALTQRVIHASDLLKACQNLFNTDVYKRKSLCERLRIEKELFPKCIQARAKYENKRKSSVFSYKNKENRRSTVFPGEETSSFQENIMENSSGFVQQWLNKNDKEFLRTPFGELNVNTQLDNTSRLRNNINTIQTKRCEYLPKKNRKRSHFKTTVKTLSPFVNDRTLITRCGSNSKRVKKYSHLSHKDDQWNVKLKECENDESGIFMDNDLIAIDDSQETVIDKDESAWAAVLEASKNEGIKSTSVVNFDCTDAITLNSTINQTQIKCDELHSKENQITKVPFYKKYYLTEPCTYCNNIINKAAGQSKELKITIANESFTTAIQIFNKFEDNLKLKTTNSVSVQTDIICGTFQNRIDVKDSDMKESTNFIKRDCMDVMSQKSVCKSDTGSEDLFADEVKIIANNYKSNSTHKYLIIAESDSDIDCNRSGPLPVKVDVHRSCDKSEYGILGEIVSISKHETRQRRGPRGLTPTSTDSSEKENFNPNRTKGYISGKKKYTKK